LITIAAVVFPDDGPRGRTAATIRRDLEQGCRQLQGFHYQIVLRELQTLSGHPDRRPRLARERVDAGRDRDGSQVRLTVQI
jgi:hypothetical protein